MLATPALDGHDLNPPAEQTRFMGALKLNRNKSGGLRVRRRETFRILSLAFSNLDSLFGTNTGRRPVGPFTFRDYMTARKSFWFGAFEGLRALQQSLNVNDENGQRVPTEAMWNGDLSRHRIQRVTRSQL